MVTERRMAELFAHANPVPDVDAIDLDQAAHLEEMQRRSSSEMTPLDTATRTYADGRSKLRLTLAGGLAIALAALVALVVLTNDDKGDVADDSDLDRTSFVGTWSVPVEGISSLFLYFGDDGRYALSNSFGAFEEQTIETGDWTFDGEHVVFTTDEGVASGCGGTEGRYTVRRLDEERISFTAAIPDPCPDRQHGMALGALRAYPLDPDFSDG